MFLAKTWAVMTLAVATALPSVSLGEDAHKAALEVEQALDRTPNLENGRRVYTTCAVCHMPEGWGTPDGMYPQIAGQSRKVIIKQLADIRARNRDNPIMFPFAMTGTLGGVQQIADVAEYISRLPMTPANMLGPRNDLAYGEQLYKDHCKECHGAAGEGDEANFVPLIQRQHYNYLLREFEWVKSGKRRNADPKMVKQIQGFTPRDVAAVLDYVSRQRPPEEKLAKPGWVNPDFPHFVRPPRP